MKLHIVTAGLLWALVPSIAWSEAVQITGRVVNKDGKAVAAVEVAEFWRRDDPGELKALPSAKTDGDGRFKLECDLASRDQPLLAFDASRKLGGIATIRASAFDKPLVIVLSPLVELRGQFTCTESGVAPDWTNVGISTVPGGARLAFYRSREPKFSIKLPAGRYELDGYGSFTDYRGVTKEITLEEGKDLYLGRSI